jgi:hypothetical protein
MIEHFAAALQGQVQLSLTPGESVKQMRIMDALERSARSGEIVRLGDTH